MILYELAAILGSWKTEFSSKDFASTFSTPDPRKILHDMVRKGFLERLEYGKYKVRSTREYVMNKNDVRGAYELLKRAKFSYALSGVDAVFAWTGGGYNIDRFFGYYPIHLKILERDVKRCSIFFKSNDKKSFLSETTPRETIFGVFYLLYPLKEVRSEMVKGLKVSPLKETLKFALENKYAFGPAIEMLDKEYNLQLDIRHSG